MRFIAATNRDLAERVKRNEFRKDLFFRLNVMVIKVPALRERTQDVPLLARHFIARYAKEFGKYVDDLHPSAVTELVAYSWPGNVRELRNVMERAVMLAKGDRVNRNEIVSPCNFRMKPVDLFPRTISICRMPKRKRKSLKNSIVATSPISLSTTKAMSPTPPTMPDCLAPIFMKSCVVT